MKRLLPLAAAIVALTGIAVVAVVSVGAISESEKTRQGDDSGGSAAGICSVEQPECNDTPLGEEAVARCTTDAVDCVDTTGGTDNICLAPDEAAAGDPMAAPECNDVIDCGAMPDTCNDLMPADPGIATDPICAGDGTGTCVDGGSPPSTEPGASGSTSYDVTVPFDASVTDDYTKLASEVILSFDPDGSFLLQESFPPTGRATIATSDPNACGAIEAKLEGTPSVGDVTCVVSATVNPPCCKPDDPVSSVPPDAPDVGQPNPGSAPDSPPADY